MTNGNKRYIMGVDNGGRHPFVRNFQIRRIYIFIEERHQLILDILSKNERISVDEIVEKFGISVESARRDLRLLDEKGLLKKTHGGAIPIHQVAYGKPKYVTGRDIYEVKENYMAIAKKAVTLIKNDDVVFITGATVGYFMTQNIPDDIQIKVVVNSIVIAEELRKRDNVQVILLGGEMDDKGNCYDAFAIEMVKRLRFDKCFITSGFITPAFGLSIRKSYVVGFLNAVIDSSKETIGLFPTEKIGFNSVFSICPANRLSKLISDWDASEEDLKAFDEQGIEIILAEK